MLPGFFEMERTYPDEDAKTWYDRLVGLDEHKSRLLIELELLFFPERLEAWSRKHHAGQVLRVCELHRNRVPLVLLEGDVGTGKTALAETVGDPLARTMKTHVHLLKINTQIRGSGQVGEMSHLIVQAFIHAEARAREKKNDPVLLLLDEADALAESRDTDQMHHEDRAGVNTLLQRVDNLRLVRLPLVAVFITNRSHALDPAIRRRAALNLRFERPDAVVRRLIFERSVPEVKLTDAQLAELVRLTGEQESRNEGLCFTASDITERLLPSAVRLAYPSRALRYEDLIEAADLMRPSPPVKTAMHVERYSDSTQHRS